MIVKRILLKNTPVARSRLIRFAQLPKLPTIFGQFPNSTSIHNLYYYNDGPEIQGGAAIVRHSNYTAFDPKTTTTKASFGVVNFDLSRSSSLYKSNLNEVRVNALFGMSLIRAY